MVDKRVFKVRARLWLAFVLGSLCGPVAAAHRCIDVKGKVTYQDVACKDVDSNSKVDTTEAFGTRPTSANTPRASARGTPPGPSKTPSGEYATYRGAWRGPLQLELSLNGVRDGGAHAMTPMVIELRPDGEVLGQALASGCRFSGLATQYLAPNMASMDVSLKGCADERFNTRYSGHLMVNEAAKEAKLRLSGLVIRPGAALSVKMQQASVDAVLKR